MRKELVPQLFSLWRSSEQLFIHILRRAMTNTPEHSFGFIIPNKYLHLNGLLRQLDIQILFFCSLENDNITVNVIAF
jgi:hypothetical protein